MLTVLNTTEAKLYLFQWQDTVYLTIVALVEGKIWLVMMSRMFIIHLQEELYCDS